jgi:ATP-dependent exoDNAse (exonuclease V) beta subunit
VVALPEPLPFSPEPLPYTTIAPSQLTEKAVQTGEDEEDPNAKARGSVTHRILERLGREHPMPEDGAVVAALLREGVAETEAKPLAKDIRQEVQRCLQEEFFSWLLGKEHPQAYCEWSLEDQPAADKIRTGNIDRVIFDGSNWWVVDYKTSRPQSGESVDTFLEREARHYRHQLLAYGEMVANYFNLDSSSVRPVLYFTALQRKVELSF